MEILESGGIFAGLHSSVPATKYKSNDDPSETSELLTQCSRCYDSSCEKILKF